MGEGEPKELSKEEFIKNVAKHLNDNPDAKLVMYGARQHVMNELEAEIFVEQIKLDLDNG